MSKLSARHAANRAARATAAASSTPTTTRAAVIAADTVVTPSGTLALAAGTEVALVAEPRPTPGYSLAMLPGDPMRACFYIRTENVRILADAGTVRHARRLAKHADARRDAFRLFGMLAASDDATEANVGERALAHLVNRSCLVELRAFVASPDVRRVLNATESRAFHAVIATQERLVVPFAPGDDDTTEDGTRGA